MDQSVIIIPTYNERDNIARIIGAALAQDAGYHVLVIDDGSPDGTADIVRQAMEDHPGRVHLVERSGKQGLGTAYVAGFKWALQRDYTYICEMDADFSHPPEDLPRLHEACHDGADVAVGSRYIKDGGTENWSLDRKYLSMGASLYVRTVTGMPVMDPTAGFVCYRREVLEALDLDAIRFVGYAFQIEMKYKSHVKGFNIVEVPIIFRDRVEGTSKMSRGIVKEGIFGVLWLKRNITSDNS